MDWEEYREIGDSVDVMTRTLLERTLPFADDQCSNAIRSVLSTEPIEKPDGFKGDRRVDLFDVRSLSAVLPSLLEGLRLSDADGIMIKQWEALAEVLNA